MMPMIFIGMFLLGTGQLNGGWFWFYIVCTILTMCIEFVKRGE